MTSQPALFPSPIARHKIPTNLTANRHPIHRWFNFIAGFSPEFVSACIHDARIEPGNGMLIDPFAGLSTSLVQSNFEGVSSIGFEVQPFFYDMSVAKLSPPRSASLLREIRECLSCLQPISDDLTAVWTDKALAFLRKLVPETDLRILANALLQEASVPQANRPMYRLAVSRVLELTAGSQTDGIYKAPTSRKRSWPYADALAVVLAEIEADLPVATRTPSLATIYPVSSESMSSVPDGSCSICVTSPPYLNNFDFAEMSRMELYFWKYAGSWGEITERVRRNMVVNTTTVPTDRKRDQEGFKKTLSISFLEKVEPISASLLARKQDRGGSKDYHLLVVPYFAQMGVIIKELARVLRPGSPLHLVVADAALYGVHIQTELLLAALMEEHSFDVLGIDRLRTRGDRWVLDKREGAGTPLGEFHIHARRS